MPKRTPEPLPTLREICMSFPEANEKLSHGEPTWFAGKGKVFATYSNNHHGDGVIAFTFPAPAGMQDMLIRQSPERFYVPKYVGHKGWVGTRLDVGQIDWGEIEDLVETAFRFVATTKLVAALDAEIEAAQGKR